MISLYYDKVTGDFMKRYDLITPEGTKDLLFEDCLAVITSYSIHYTKLYELPALESDDRFHFWKNSGAVQMFLHVKHAG